MSGIRCIAAMDLASAESESKTVCEQVNEGIYSERQEQQISQATEEYRTKLRRIIEQTPG